MARAATPLSEELWTPLGVTSILLGGGRGHVSDYSAVDNNPAGIALQKTYMLSGDMGWTGQKSRQAEAAVCDSATSELAACLKFRQTQQISGARDRRYSVALAEVLGEASGVTLGLAGDYIQFSKTRGIDAISAPSSYTGQRVRAGLLYLPAEGVLVGVSSDGLYDSTDTQIAHGFGVSVQAGKYFLFNGDLNFSSDRLKDGALGMTIFPKDFLDLAVSYGYDPRESSHKTAAGVVVKSQQARIIYSLAKADDHSAKWVHRIGIGIYMAGDAGVR